MKIEIKVKNGNTFIKENKIYTKKDKGKKIISIAEELIELENIFRINLTDVRNNGVDNKILEVEELLPYTVLNYNDKHSHNGCKDRVCKRK